MPSNNKRNIHFTYSPSPPPHNPTTNQHHITTTNQPHHNVQKQQRQSLFSESHIKIIEQVDANKQRERRRKIFSEVRQISNYEMSKQRNKSLKIFQGGISQQERMRLLLSKSIEGRMVQKSDNVQTRSNYKQEPRISNFMIPFINESSCSTKMKMVRLRDQISSPAELSSSARPYLPENSSLIQSKLNQKERELTRLQLELERYQRCQKISKENQSIYQRLVSELNKSKGQLDEAHTSKSRFNRVQNEKSQAKSYYSKNNNSMSYEETNQFKFSEPLSVQKPQVYQELNKQVSFGGSKNIDFQAIKNDNRLIPNITFQKNDNVLQNHQHHNQHNNVHQNDKVDRHRHQKNDVRMLESGVMHVDSDEILGWNRLREINSKLQMKIRKQSRPHYSESYTTRSSGIFREEKKSNLYRPQKGSYYHPINCKYLLH